jgi:hypothetical protein
VVRHFKKASCAREIALSYSSAEAVRTLASFCPIDRRDFVNLCATPAPFAVKDASVIVSQTEFL